MSRAVTGPDGRTWTVGRRWVPRLGAESLDARASDGSCMVWRVVGWRASGEQVDRVVGRLSAGVIPPGALRTWQI